VIILPAGLIVARKEKEEWKFLLLRAFRNGDFPKVDVNLFEELSLSELRKCLWERKTIF